MQMLSDIIIHVYNFCVIVSFVNLVSDLRSHNYRYVLVKFEMSTSSFGFKSVFLNFGLDRYQVQL